MLNLVQCAFQTNINCLHPLHQHQPVRVRHKSSWSLINDDDQPTRCRQSCKSYKSVWNIFLPANTQPKCSQLQLVFLSLGEPVANHIPAIWPNWATIVGAFADTPRYHLSVVTTHVKPTFLWPPHLQPVNIIWRSSGIKIGVLIQVLFIFPTSVSVALQYRHADEALLSAK